MTTLKYECKGFVRSVYNTIYNLYVALKEKVVN